MMNLTGQLLLASPALRDSVFERSVILITDHEADHGANGLILNHPLGQHRVGDFLKQDEFSSLAQIQVYVGGPVGREHLSFTSLEWEPDRGLTWSSRINAQEASIQTQKHGALLRAFIGYSGWSPGQLENEIEQQSWMVLEPSKELLGQEHDRSLWAATLSPVSTYHRIIAQTPDRPELN